MPRLATSPGTAVVTLEKDIADDILKQAVSEQGYKVTEIM